MRIIFMGTPYFAVPSLKGIIKAGHEVCGVFTQPDKPVGRKKILTPPPIKVTAQENQIEIFQPNTLRNNDIVDKIASINPDMIVVAAYGKILPKSILNIPKYGCVNVHGSLLPKYRGAAPIQWSIINGEKETGITTMYMAEGLDTGDIIIMEKTQIGNDETSEELYKRLSEIGAKLIVNTIKMIEEGNAPRTKQDDTLASCCTILNKSIGKIDWNKPSGDIHNLVRGLNPWPVAYTELEGKSFKIYKTKLSSMKSTVPGQIINLSPLTIGCGDGESLELCEVQLEGKKRLSSYEFTKGYKFEDNTVLGG